MAVAKVESDRFVGGALLGLFGKGAAVDHGLLKGVNCSLEVALLVVDNPDFVKDRGVGGAEFLGLFKFPERGLEVVHAEVLHADVERSLVAAGEESRRCSVRGHRGVRLILC